MAAAKLLDTISTLSGVTGKASDAVSAYAQVKMTESPRLLRLPERVCPAPKEFKRSPMSGRPVEEVLFENRWKKKQTWECLYVH